MSHATFFQTGFQLEALLANISVCRLLGSPSPESCLPTASTVLPGWAVLSESCHLVTSVLSPPGSCGLSPVTEVKYLTWPPSPDLIHHLTPHLQDVSFLFKAPCCFWSGIKPGGPACSLPSATNFYWVALQGSWGWLWRTDCLSDLVNDVEMLHKGEQKCSSLRRRVGLGHHNSPQDSCLLTQMWREIHLQDRTFCSASFELKFVLKDMMKAATKGNLYQDLGFFSSSSRGKTEVYEWLEWTRCSWSDHFGGKGRERHFTQSDF